MSFYVAGALTKVVSNFYSSYRFSRNNVLRRRVVRVLNQPGEIKPIRDEDLNTNLLRNIQKSQVSDVDILEKTDKKLIVPAYEKLQKNDVRFTKILGVVKNRKLRERKGKMLLEGKRLINDAIKAGVELQTVYFSREKDLAGINFRDQNKAEILKVLYRTMKVWSDLDTCPGVMGVFKRPTTESVHIISEPTIPVTVLCDNIRDPGNLGSIIRNSAAAGCECILLLKGCVDPWENKVLRTGCGGHFRIPIVNDIEWTHIHNYIPKDSLIIIADNTADIEGHSESPEFINFDEGIEGGDEQRYVSLNEHQQPVSIDETFNEPSELEKYREMDFPCHLYSSLAYPRKSIFLYVGGETHGVDSRAIKLACEFGGKKVKVPLENEIDSLNSAFAATLIIYEIKRQLKETYVTK